VDLSGGVDVDAGGCSGHVDRLCADDGVARRVDLGDALLSRIEDEDRVRRLVECEPDGLTADRDALPDPERYEACLTAAVDELLEAARARTGATKRGAQRAAR